MRKSSDGSEAQVSAGGGQPRGRGPRARARGARRGARRALSEQVQSGNQELARLKHEEQAVESLVADLARVLQDFPVDSRQSFDQLRGKLPGRCAAR